MLSKKNAIHVPLSCYLVTLDIGLWWLVGKFSLKSNNDLGPPPDFPFGL